MKLKYTNISNFKCKAGTIKQFDINEWTIKTKITNSGVGFFKSIKEAKKVMKEIYQMEIDFEKKLQKKLSKFKVKKYPLL